MVGLSSTQLWGYRVPEALEIAASLGYTSVEVWAEQAWMHADAASEIRRRAQEVGLHLTVHSASWDLNLTARNEGIRRTSTEQVIRSIDLAAELGATMITVHPGRATLHGKDLEWHWERQVESFHLLASEGADRGVLVNVELMEPIRRELCTEPEDINRLLAAVSHPNLGVTFDVAHVPIDRDPDQMLRGLHRADEIHISDSTRDKLHVPLGKGEINFMPVLRLVAEIGAPVTIEGFEPRRTNELALWNKGMFDRLWAQAVSDTAATKG